MPDPLDEISTLAEAIYRSEEARIREITAQESRLRNALADLESHSCQNRSLPDADLSGVRQIGADILWQGWVGRNKRELNLELAQVLARKSGMMQGLRRAFGRQVAAETLVENARAGADTARQKRQSETDQALMLLQEIGKRDRAHPNG